MTWGVVQPKPIDVQGMLRRASNRVRLKSLLQQGDRNLHVLSRSLLDKLITQAITETIHRLRDEGAMTLALTESRLASESRKELNSILNKIRQTGASDEEVFFADEDDERRVVPFDGTELDLGRGLDWGSASIFASAKSRISGKPLINLQRNAFLEVPGDGFTQSLLRKFGIDCVVRGTRAYVLGDLAFELATIFDKPVRRPLKDSAGADPDGAFVVRHLLERILGRPQKPGEICVYSVPGEPVDPDRKFIYLQGVLEESLRALGYTPRPMLESHVLIHQEFKESAYTGMAVTWGGSTANVCVACKGVPALSFSTSRGGEWVDRNVAKALNLPDAQVCAAKERGMNLFQPQDHVEGAIAIYYRHLIQFTLEAIQRKLNGADAVPSFSGPIDLVCAGGSAMVGGFLEMFQQELQKVQLPIPIGRIRLAQIPLEAVAAGCLRAALEETRALQDSPVEMTPAVAARAPMTVTAPTARPKWFGTAA
jgi:hypothetical protein